MNIKAATTRLLLPRADTLTLDDARGALVRCLEGDLWITQPGDPTDHVVAAGETFRVDRDGPVVLQAVRAARVTIESPREEALERWWDPLARDARATGTCG